MNAFLALALSIFLCQMPPRYVPEKTPKNRIPARPLEAQGEVPDTTWPPLPNALQNKGDLMNEPQPQVNPEGPSIYGFD